jgi:ferredoxin-NADP reductase
VHEAIELPAVQDVMAYLAGPPAMVEAASAMLAARGLAPRQIHADAFYNQS